MRGHVDGGGERLAEALEAAVVAAGLGQLEQLALGVLDLLARREIDRRVVGDVDHLLADLDQRAADGEIVDGAAVVGGVDDGGGLGREPRQVLAHIEPADIDIGVEERLQRHRRGDLAGADQVAAELIDVLVDRLEEVCGLEEVGNPVVRLVIDQDGAQQRLLRLDIVRRGAVVRARLCGRLACD